MKLVIVLVLACVVSACTSSHPCKPTGKEVREVQPILDDEVLPTEYTRKEYTCTGDAHWI